MGPAGKARDFVVRQESPFNGGPALVHLAAGPVTPLEHFFVRNHGDVPAVDPPAHRLTVAGEVSRPLALAPAELAARFPRRALTATLQCAGNRRAELAAVRPIPGELGWGSEAIGTAEWVGIALADLLVAAGVGPEARHVELVGLDETERSGARIRFGGSIPLEKALAGEVLLATEMNGRPLPPLHGAPLRAVVPGYVGARSVKWLAEVRVRREPSDNYFQRRAYRLFAPHVGAGDVVWDEGLMLGELAVNSIITAPAGGATLPAGPVRVEGLALAGGGRTVERVDLSIDGGASWRTARLAAAPGRWACRRWSQVLELPPGEHEIVARAWDSAAQTQPERPAQLWNFKGYGNNAWCRVAVRCV